MFHPAELVQWYETRSNLRISRPPAPSAFWPLFMARGAPLTGVPESLESAASGPTDLLIVLTTYDRARLCERKLESLPELIRRAGRLEHVHLLVLCDASSDDYGPARMLAQRLFGSAVTWLDAHTHLGKANYWKTYQTAFLAAKRLQPIHTLFLQDDVQYEADLLRDAYALWDNTESDPNRRLIYLFSTDDDEAQGRWIRFVRDELPALGLRLTQWFDLQSYLVDRAFFEQLDYRMVPVHPNRWRRKAQLSSGVGAQLTRRLFGRANLYQAWPALVVHGAHQSKMNPGARAVRSLDNLALLHTGFDAIC